jgi:hypothetical protein
MQQPGCESTRRLDGIGVSVWVGIGSSFGPSGPSGGVGRRVGIGSSSRVGTGLVGTGRIGVRTGCRLHECRHGPGDTADFGDDTGRHAL